MDSSVSTVRIEEDAPIPTWFGVGGRADRFARPLNAPELRDCLKIDPDLKVLGDGANLLVDDDGVSELVIELSSADFKAATFNATTGSLIVGAGHKLPQLINETVRRGLAGLHVLGGIPATVGGALVMNAGGAFGQICDTVVRVFALDREGRDRVLERRDIPFAYRRSGLEGFVLTGAEFALTPSDPEELRRKHLEVMDYKKRTQPMADSSAGCAFKNPTLTRDTLIPDDAGTDQPAKAGARVSAGMLIDRAGCKGLTVGGAVVSDRHGNFLTAGAGAKARDVIDLMERVRERVFARFGVTLENEVVVWRRR